MVFDDVSARGFGTWFRSRLSVISCPIPAIAKLSGTLRAYAGPAQPPRGVTLLFLKGGYAYERARLDGRDCMLNLRQDRPQTRQSCVAGSEHHDPNAEVRDALLILEILICRKQHVEFMRRGAK